MGENHVGRVDRRPQRCWIVWAEGQRIHPLELTGGPSAMRDCDIAVVRENACELERADAEPGHIRADLVVADEQDARTRHRSNSRNARA